MLLLKTEKRPDDPRWLYQLKLDGYRTIGFKTGGKLHCVFSKRQGFRGTVSRRHEGPNEAPRRNGDRRGGGGFDAEGVRRSTRCRITDRRELRAFTTFDVMILAGTDVRRERLEKRRQLLDKKVLPKLTEPVRYPGVGGGRTLGKN